MHGQIADQTSELLSLTEDWFSRLARRDPNVALRTVLGIARQPFAELHLAALGVLGALAALPWGQSRFNVQPGFHEYLLDRSTERGAKEGLEEKFSVVRTLAESPTCGDVFGREYQMKLREYVRDGPFYMPAETRVAFESS